MKTARRFLLKAVKEKPSIDILLNGLPDLKKLRKQRGFSLVYVQEKTGLTTDYIYKIETDKIKRPSFDTVMKLICLYYDINQTT